MTTGEGGDVVTLASDETEDPGAVPRKGDTVVFTGGTFGPQTEYEKDAAAMIRRSGKKVGETRFTVSDVEHRFEMHDDDLAIESHTIAVWLAIASEEMVFVPFCGCGTKREREDGRCKFCGGRARS